MNQTSIIERDAEATGAAVQEQAPSSGKVPYGRVIFLSVIVTVLNPLGNAALSWGMKHLNTLVELNPLGYVRAMMNPAAAAGIALLILWLLMRMALMSWTDLSFVLPVTSGGYALSAVMGKYFLHEAVNVQQWFGIALIVAGASLAGSQHSKLSSTDDAFANHD